MVTWLALIHLGALAMLLVLFDDTRPLHWHD